MFAIIETIGGKRPHERQVGDTHPTHAAATDWLDRNVKGDARRAYSVRAV